MTRYSIEPNTRKDIKAYGFWSFTRNLFSKFGKQLLDTASKTGQDASKNLTKKIAYKAAETTGKLIGSKTIDWIT